MKLVLSSADQLQLANAIETLVSPLAYASTDGWRSAVNRSLKELLRSDAVGFLLPCEDGPFLYSEEMDASRSSQYSNFEPPPPPSGQSAWLRCVQLGVWSLYDVYAPLPSVYFEGEYYNEYAKPSRAIDTIAMTTSLPGWGTELSPDDLFAQSSVQFWRCTERGYRFGERELALLRIVRPALQAGVHAYRNFANDRAQLMGALDRLGRRVLVMSPAGEVIHQTPGLSELLATDPAGDEIRHQLLAIGGGLAFTLRDPRPGAPPVVEREIVTPTATYLGRSSLLHAGTASDRALILVVIDRLTPHPYSDQELRDLFRLTRAEIGVARLLAHGRQNAEIASQLSISRRTVERHVENLLRKLNARTRGEVAATLLRHRAPPEDRR